MDILSAIKARRSVRSYTEARIEGETYESLMEEIKQCNSEGGLNIQLIRDEPRAFGGLISKYGRFRGVRNYIALVGKKSADLEEKAGYYGERVVLRAQQLGLNSCWVALTFSKGKCGCIVSDGEKLVCVISLGYGTTQGNPHKSKPMESVYRAEEPIPNWFLSGMESVMLAPTAINQQKFLLTLSEDGKTVGAEATGGFNSKIDLGIVKYHFEVGAGDADWIWEDA